MITRVIAHAWTVQLPGFRALTTASRAVSVMPDCLVAGASLWLSQNGTWLSHASPTRRSRRSCAGNSLRPAIRWWTRTGTGISGTATQWIGS